MLGVIYLLSGVTLQALEDKTFGLKNKSKSAKVQGYALCVKSAVPMSIFAWCANASMR